MPYTMELMDTRVPVCRADAKEEREIVERYGTDVEVIFKPLPTGVMLRIRKVSRAEARRHPTMDDLEASGPGR